MKPLLFLSFLFAALNVGAQVTVKNNQIILGKTDSVYSKIIGEKRKVWIYLPGDYNDISLPRKIYPVVYLLDGDGHFSSIAGMIQQLSEVNGNMVLPQMIIVAIPNTNRMRDLTPSQAKTSYEGKKDPALAITGGGEKFTAFIQQELMPHIDSAYRTAPYKLFIGHSLGGLMVINTLINHSDMFNAYIAIDPSMWWDGKKLLTQARQLLDQKRFGGKSLYMGIANTMDEGMDTLKVRKDTANASLHIRSILALKDMLQNKAADGLTFGYQYYSNDTHSSAPLITAYDGMRFLFPFYKMPAGAESKIETDDAFDIPAFYSNFYADISKHMGYKVLPNQGDLNQTGYYFLQAHKPQKAYQFFAINIANYPQSANAYDSMGDYYADQKNKAKAIEMFTKAYQLGKNPDTKKKLDKLVAGK
ncbi:alpha/beta hydrolase-fold protein [Mucilaginibacter psychrotolerans]|nr:alpha/beta hydrolase-fold protein [Mucilaginibacter psychrotolerans]